MPFEATPISRHAPAATPARPAIPRKIGFIDADAAIDEIRAGRLVIVVDGEGAESEGDICVAAASCSAETVNLMATYARGLIRVAMTGERLDALDLAPMVEAGPDSPGSAFAISVEARTGVTAGISAHDRARTIAVLADPSSAPSDLVQPGHVFPLRTASGGVLARRGRAEAAVDLARLAGRTPAAVICQVLREDGDIARLPELAALSKRLGIPIVTVDALVQHRYSREVHCVRADEEIVPTAWGDTRLISYDSIDGVERMALIIGDVSGGDGPPLVRIHDRCATGDVFGSLRCDCGEQLRSALSQMAAAGRGVLIYTGHEGRGIGLHNKIRAYALQDAGLDTVEANEMLGFAQDTREHTLAGQILLDVGVTAVRLMTNNPEKQEAVERVGVTVVERVGLTTEVTPHNVRYLATKRDRMGHLLPREAPRVESA